MPRAAIAMKGARNDWTGVSAGGLESATKYPHGCHQNTRFYVTSWPLGNLARAPAITIGWAASRICRVARKSTHPLMSYRGVPSWLPSRTSIVAIIGMLGPASQRSPRKRGREILNAVPRPSSDV